MRQIQFNENKYDLIDRENVSASHFQVTILKESYSVESIANDAMRSEEIKIYEGEEVKAIYKGYNDLIMASMYEIDDRKVVSVELLNHNYEEQLNELAAKQEVQDGAIAELGEAVSEVAEANDTQDSAINDLAVAVDELASKEA